jgi:hypothetical protein
MAYRTLSRRIMLPQPAKTCISGLINAEKSSTASHDTVRRMAYAARENAPLEDNQIEGTRRENSSNSPTYRPSSGLGRSGYARRRPTELSSVLGKTSLFATKVDSMLDVDYELLSLFFGVWNAQNIVEKCHQFSSGGLVWSLTLKERLRIMIC